MKRKLCDCGRSIYGIGSRCMVCAQERLEERALRPAKFPRIELPDDGRYPAHLAWIRSLPCAVPTCRAKSQAAHVRWNTGGGMQLKPADWWTVPLCHHHHIIELHNMSHPEFDAKYGIDLRALAERLAAESPYLPKES
jgi:hypothetical protein